MTLLKDLLVKKDQEDIEKNTFNDKRRIIADSLEKNFSVDGETAYSWLYDLDYEYVYFEIYIPEEGYKYYRATYEFMGTSATFGEEAEEVVRLTEWRIVASEQEDTEKSFSDKVTAVIHKLFGNTQAHSHLPLIKQFDEEQMIAVEQLYIKAGDVDGVGDTYTLEETHKMVDSFNKANEDGILKSNYFHKAMTDDFSIEKAWVSEIDCMIGETHVEEGTPLVKIKFNNEQAWDLRKSGDLCGVSIGAKATFEDVK